MSVHNELELRYFVDKLMFCFGGIYEQLRLRLIIIIYVVNSMRKYI